MISYTSGEYSKFIISYTPNRPLTTNHKEAET